MSATRVALAVVLGVSAFGVASLSDELLGAARSPTPAATFVIMAVYLALCQFFVATKGVGLRANVATLLGMAAPWFLLFLVTVSFESRATIISQGIPSLLAGSLGPLVGAIVAGAFRPGGRASNERSGHSLPRSPGSSSS